MQVNAGVPYVLLGGTPFWGRTEVKDVVAYLRLAVNLDDATGAPLLFGHNIVGVRLDDEAALKASPEDVGGTPKSVAPFCAVPGITERAATFCVRCCSPEAGDQRAAAEARRRQPGGPRRLGGGAGPAARRRPLPGLQGAFGNPACIEPPAGKRAGKVPCCGTAQTRRFVAHLSIAGRRAEGHRLQGHMLCQLSKDAVIHMLSATCTSILSSSDLLLTEDALSSMCTVC